MALRVYNTMTRKKEPFETLEPGVVKMYVCGPTVYDKAHVGHAMSVLVFDMVRRYLEHKGYRVRHVMNYTDVDDKIIRRARELGEDPIALAERYIREFDQHLEDLGVLQPHVKPRVTQEIDWIIKMVKGLEDKGYAYAVDGDVYFRVTKDEDYGKLSGRKLDEMMAGARIEVDERKEHPMDFALWKAAKPGEPSWESPWGKGRPGWHIECSAMNLHHLGEQLDIHGGGADLIFPHHENERAQAYAAFGSGFARYWLHNGFVTVREEKMSKSLHNFLTIKDVVAEYHPEALKYLLLSMGYRKPINYGETAMAEAEDRVEYFYESIAAAREYLDRRGGEIDEAVVKQSMDRFVDFMDDDFNTAGVLGGLNTDVRALNEALAMKGKSPQKGSRIASLLEAILRQGKVLGLFQSDPAEVLNGIRDRRVRSLNITPAEIDTLIHKRAEARKARDFQEADRIRNELAARGITLMDTASGTQWKARRQGG